nr:hypothetical protein [Tanacetum cinerariifolium]
MTSFGYRSNPRYAIKECSSWEPCTPETELEENLVTHSLDLQNTSEPSNASTNIVNAPREPYVVKQDHGSFVDKIIFDLNRAPDSPHLHTILTNQFHCFHCKDLLRDRKACKRCTYAKCGSGLGKGLCYICGHNQNSLNDSPSIFEPSSQSPPNINHCCYECGDPLEGIFCKRCTRMSCGKDAHIGYNCPSNVSVISNPKPCNNQTIAELPQPLPIFHPTFHSEANSPFTLDSTPTYVNLLTFLTHLHNLLYEFIKSSVETLISIPSESEGILEHVCDVPSHDNSSPLDVSKDQFKDFSESNEEFSSIDDDSFSIDNMDYVEASPSDSELVSSEVMEIVIPEVGGIDDDILLTIKDDILREKLLNVNILIAKIEALNANLTPSFDCKTKSSSTSLNSLLKETNTFDNSLPEFETFYFDVKR